jgi:hypothetical protein
LGQLLFDECDLRSGGRRRSAAIARSDFPGNRYRPKIVYIIRSERRPGISAVLHAEFAKNLTRRANHLHIYILASFEPAPETPVAGYFNGALSSRTSTETQERGRLPGARSYV